MDLAWMIALRHMKVEPKGFMNIVISLVQALNFFIGMDLVFLNALLLYIKE